MRFSSITLYEMPRTAERVLTRSSCTVYVDKFSKTLHTIFFNTEKQRLVCKTRRLPVSLTNLPLTQRSGDSRPSP